MSIREHFPRPLREVSAQIAFARRIVMDFRADSLYQKIRDQFPDINATPYFFVPPPNEIMPAQLYSPMYKFQDKEERHLVQYGPNLLAINAITWEDGYPGFRRAVESVTRAFAETNSGDLVSGYSLGFYNTLGVENWSDVAWLLRRSIPIGDDTDFAGFSLQRSKTIHCGVLTTQFTTAQNDAGARQLLMNNILNVNRGADRLDVPDWMTWLDEAHQRARDAFWDDLSDNARDVWNRTYAAERGV